MSAISTKRVLFIAKTNLNNDGRILNEMALLKDTFKDLQIDFVLLPDKPTQIALGDFVNLHEINLKFRHSKLLRPLTVLEFTWKSLKQMLNLKPEIVHVQDTAVVLPCLLFSFLRPNVPLIYDDHEIPNENESLSKKLFNRLEVWLMKRSDYVLHANQERMELINESHNVKTPSSYFLNLPYFEDDTVEPDAKDSELLQQIDMERARGTKFLMHQGVIVKQRGSEALADFSKSLPVGYKILLLGGNREGYENFLSSTGADETKFWFVGSVNYTVLPLFWNRVIASIIMYLPTYINNRLCAPNRFYLSVQKELPVIVNRANPVLNNFVKKYNCGLFIDDATQEQWFDTLEEMYGQQAEIDFQELKREQINNLTRAYL